MNNHLKIAMMSLAVCTASFGQSVGINETGATAESSALLDVSSTTKGFLAPRMTETQRKAISSPAKGLVVFQIDGSSGVWVFDTAWKLLGDQDLTDFVIKTELADSISQIRSEIPFESITLNSAKVGITPSQASTILENKAAIAINSGNTGISTSQSDAIVANTAKVGITSAQATAISDNTSATALNTAKVGITSAQATAISDNTAATALNTAKVGITSAQATAITNNTSAIALKSNIASPTFTGTVTIPTLVSGALTYPNTDGTANQVLKTDGSGTLSWSTPAGSGDLVSTNNLSDVTNASTSRTNLGLAIGTNVQAYDADLTTYAGITPSANVQSLLGSADYATVRTNLTLGNVDNTSDANKPVSTAGQTALDLKANIASPTFTGTVTASTLVSGALTYPNTDGTANQVLKTDGSGALSWSTPAGSGDLVSTNNLSDVTNNGTARTNLGVAIGTNVQAYDADLADLADGSLTATKIAGGNVSDTEFDYLNGVTSGIQTQLDAKATSLDGLSDAKAGGADFAASLMIGETHTGTLSAAYNNIGIGDNAFYDLTSGQFNIGIGVEGLADLNSGSSNVGIGNGVLRQVTTGSNNTALGRSAGYTNQTGSYNVFLGSRAGYNETGSNKLYIDNSNTSTPLIYGDFSTDELTVNGTFSMKNGSTSSGSMDIYEDSDDGTNKVTIQSQAMGSDYTLTLPVDDGTASQVLTTDGSGSLSWTTPSGGAVADNSITGAKIALGSDAQGDVMYYNGTDWARLAPGTSGQVLQTNGVGSNPTWVTPSAGGFAVTSVSSNTTIGTEDQIVIITGAVTVTLPSSPRTGQYVILTTNDASANLDPGTKSIRFNSGDYTGSATFTTWWGATKGKIVYDGTIWHSL